jgi:hypothetical protein
MTSTVDEWTEAASQLALVERTQRQQLRNALVEVGRHLGWDRQTVMRLSETIAGRPWQRCGATEVVRVARVLLEVAAALRSACAPGGIVVDADARVGQDVAGVNRLAGLNHVD